MRSTQARHELRRFEAREALRRTNRAQDRRSELARIRRSGSQRDVERLRSREAARDQLDALQSRVELGALRRRHARFELDSIERILAIRTLRPETRAFFLRRRESLTGVDPASDLHRELRQLEADVARRERAEERARERGAPFARSPH